MWQWRGPFVSHSMSTWTCLGSSPGISPLRTGAVVLHDSMFLSLPFADEKNKCPCCQHFRFQTSSDLEAILGQWGTLYKLTLKGSVYNTVGSQKDCTRLSDHKWSYKWCYKLSNVMIKPQSWCVRHLIRLTLQPQHQRRYMLLWSFRVWACWCHTNDETAERIILKDPSQFQRHPKM